jgi:hypothetical protein
MNERLSHRADRAAARLPGLALNCADIQTTEVATSGLSTAARLGVPEARGDRDPIAGKDETEQRLSRQR